MEVTKLYERAEIGEYSDVYYISLFDCEGDLYRVNIKLSPGGHEEECYAKLQKWTEINGWTGFNFIIELNVLNLMGRGEDDLRKDNMFQFLYEAHNDEEKLLEVLKKIPSRRENGELPNKTQ
jgi:hypothetical protein